MNEKVENQIIKTHQIPKPTANVQRKTSEKVLQKRRSVLRQPPQPETRTILPMVSKRQQIDIIPESQTAQGIEIVKEVSQKIAIIRKMVLAGNLNAIRQILDDVEPKIIKFISDVAPQTSS